MNCCCAQVTQLLDHENVDVALAAIDLVNELTDPEAILETEESDGAKVYFCDCLEVIPIMRVASTFN
jgi:hypothetical protein